MTWKILTTKRFEKWFEEQHNDLQEKMLAVMGHLRFWGLVCLVPMLTL